MTSNDDFSSGTGSTKPISEVEIGDRVSATDPETGETTDREVTATFVHGDEGDALVRLTVTAQDGSQGTVEGTSWHPVWLVEEHRFVNLGDLEPGRHLTAADGSSPTVTAVEIHTRRLRPHHRHRPHVLCAGLRHFSAGSQLRCIVRCRTAQ